MKKNFSKLTTTGSAPPPCSGPGVAALGKAIYFFGGIKDNFATKVNTTFDDLYRLDTQTLHWEKITPTGPKPPARAYPVMIGDSQKNQIVLFGGADYSADFKTKMIMFNEIWTYSPEQNQWTELKPSTPAPVSRSKPSGWLINNKLYIFGGVTATWEVLNDLWAYDFATNQWAEIVPKNAAGSPPPRHEALNGITATKNGKLIIYGGEGSYDKEANRFSTLNDTWEFDLATKTWREITPAAPNNIMPPRNFACAVMLDDRLIIQGGAMDGVGYVSVAECGAPFPQRGMSDEVWSFDCNKKIWTKLGITGDGFPRIKRNSAALLDGKMYIFSGFDFQWYGKGPGQIWNESVYCFDTNGYFN